MTLEEALMADLDRLDPAYRSGFLAQLALILARRLDTGKVGLRDTATAVRCLRELWMDLQAHRATPSPEDIGKLREALHAHGF